MTQKHSQDFLDSLSQFHFWLILTKLHIVSNTLIVKRFDWLFSCILSWHFKKKKLTLSFFCLFDRWLHMENSVDLLKKIKRTNVLFGMGLDTSLKHMLQDNGLFGMLKSQANSSKPIMQDSLISHSQKIYLWKSHFYFLFFIFYFFIFFNFLIFLIFFLLHN